MTETIRSFAERLKVGRLIARAVTYDPDLQDIWSVQVEWSHRLKTATGRGGRRGISLHPALQNNLAELRATFLHEVAHCMEWLLYRKVGHGQNWWEAMIRLGEKPWLNRTHSIGAELRAYAAKPGSTERMEDLGL